MRNSALFCTQNNVIVRLKEFDIHTAYLDGPVHLRPGQLKPGHLGSNPFAGLQRKQRRFCQSPLSMSITTPQTKTTKPSIRTKWDYYESPPHVEQPLTTEPCCQVQHQPPCQPMSTLAVNLCQPCCQPRCSILNGPGQTRPGRYRLAYLFSRAQRWAWASPGGLINVVCLELPRQPE